MKEYERQKKSDEDELNQIANEANQKKLDKFIRIEKNIVDTSKIGGSSSSKFISKFNR
jgi:hypothetical protein